MLNYKCSLPGLIYYLFFRFYGRIATSCNDHDIETLMTIKEKAGGLSKLSVERVWMEIQKILVGNHVFHLFELMYELGVAQNIGEVILKHL